MFPSVTIANSKQPTSFAVTPHKLSVCILVQVYAPPSQISIPIPFSSVSHHNRLGIFLLTLTKACDGILEPTLDELTGLLKDVEGYQDDWLCELLTSRLSSLSSPDDLFDFFSEMRGILGAPDSNAMDDDQIMLDPNSIIGMFVRRCILAFNQMPFEGICHLLTNMGTYCKESSSGYSPYELANLDSSNASLDFENVDIDRFTYESGTGSFEGSRKRIGRSRFHGHVAEPFLEDSDFSLRSRLEDTETPLEVSPSTSSSIGILEGIGSLSGTFLRTNWQVQGYLSEQASSIEKHQSSFPVRAFESILNKLQKLAPELHRVHYLRYLNSLYHDDYPGALESLHRYFDYSAGTEGIEFALPPSGRSDLGRYETALLYLGMMHFHFGHPKQALEVLTEAVQVSQQHSDDICLAYTLTTISSILSEVGISTMSGLVGSSYWPVAGIGASLSVQQQLYVLLRRSLKRADSIKLKRLVASIHLEIAKYDLTHVQRPLLSFGPKASMKLRTCPPNVHKELWLSSHLINEFTDEIAIMVTDGAFCTAWLKKLKKPTGSSIFTDEIAAGCKYTALQVCVQPSSVPGSVLQLLGSSYLVRVASWEMYGSTPLARINALVYATCFADSSSSADAALAYSKLIQHLSMNKGYKEAFAALKVAEEKFVCISKSRIQLVRLQVLHEYALHRGHIKLAHKLCDELGVLASSVAGVDLELKTEASLRHARTLLAANQYSQAADTAHSLFNTCYKFNLQVKNATVLLLLAEIHKRSGNAVMGIPYALASLSYCQSFNLDLLKASAILTLAELWLSLGSNHAKKALRLLHGSFQLLIGHGGLEVRSRAFITEAKCYLADPTFSVLDDPEMVLEPLRQASEELQLLEYHELASEAFYLMAIVYDKMGNLDEREEAAGSFKKHIIALENYEGIEDDLLLDEMIR